MSMWIRSVVGLVLALGSVVVIAGCGDDAVTGDAGAADATAADASPLDVVAPVAGSGPAFSALSATSLTVGWGDAADDVTDPAELRYKVVRADSVDAIDTLAEVAAITGGAGLALDFVAGVMAVDIDSLAAATEYAFAVVVEDAAGNQALFAPASVTTLDGSAPTVGTGVTFANLATTSVTASWGAATDDVTASTALQYKLVRAATTLEIDTLAEVAAITTGPALVLDFTADATTAPATGLTSANAYAFAVVVKDAAGNESLYAPAVVTTLDDIDPTVTLTSPTAAGTFTTSASSIALAGSASDNVAVTSVTWANAANATSGGATGTTAWTIASVTLVEGENVITVTATDGAANLATDTITITRVSNPALTSIYPTNTLSTVTTSGVVITGSDLSVNAAVTVAGVVVPTVNCNYAGVPTQIVCTVPASNSVVRGGVTVTNPDGQPATLINGFTFTGFTNETNVAGEADFCNLQFPLTATANTNQPSPLIFGQIFEAGVTDATIGSAAPGILAELGFGPTTVNPTNTVGWSFFAAEFHAENGLNNNNDEYKATVTISSSGTFSYTFRFSLDGGLNFTYCDMGSDAGGDGGAGSNGGLTFEANQLGTITVN